MAEKRGRGAPARGPFTNKRVSFSSRFTEETMTELAAAAERDFLSVSQKGELLIRWGLQAEDFIRASLDPAWTAFQQRVVKIVAKHKGLPSSEAKEVEKELHAAIDALAADLKTHTYGAPISAEHVDNAAASVVAPRGELVTRGEDAKAAKPTSRRRLLNTDD